MNRRLMPAPAIQMAPTLPLGVMFSTLVCREWRHSEAITQPV